MTVGLKTVCNGLREKYAAKYPLYDGIIFFVRESGNTVLVISAILETAFIGLR